jgi:hypothetical protein
MGSTIQDAFYAPHDLAKEIQGFLADNDELFSKRSAHETAVVFSVASTRALIGKADSSDNTQNATDETVRVPYRVVTRTLSASSAPYDVVIFPDGTTAPDQVTATSLRRYDCVVLPDCWYLTPGQADALRSYLDGGGMLVVVDRFGDNLDPGERAELLTHPRVRSAGMDDADALQPLGAQVHIDGAEGIGVNLALLDDGVAVHLVNYSYDRESDQVVTVRSAELAVRLQDRAARAEFVDSRGTRQRLDVGQRDGSHVVRLPELGVYGVVVFSGTASAGDRGQQLPAQGEESETR